MGLFFGKKEIISLEKQFKSPKVLFFFLRRMFHVLLCTSAKREDGKVQGWPRSRLLQTLWAPCHSWIWRKERRKAVPTFSCLGTSQRSTSLGLSRRNHTSAALQGHQGWNPQQDVALGCCLSSPARAPLFPGEKRAVQHRKGKLSVIFNSLSLPQISGGGQELRQG